jgi:DNA-binding response OmpR family regulator
MARIIIADDDEVVGEIVLDALLASGHDGELVEDGAEALRLVKARSPDLLVLDSNMPGMSGVMVLQELRDTPALRRLPVMMLTGRRSKQDVDTAMSAGADAYLTKPFDPDELVAMVEGLLARDMASRSSA